MTIVYLKKSNKKDKKYMVYVDGKTIHFGYAPMSDFTRHHDYDRMKRYENRHRKRENWTKSGIKTAGFWSKWILWNKPSFEASKRDTARRFGITFKSGWPKEKVSMSYFNKKRSNKKSYSNKKSKKQSRKPKRSCAYISKSGRCYKKKPSPKYERCVLAVKSRQPKRCSRTGYKGKGCYSPWAVCTARVNRYGK